MAITNLPYDDALILSGIRATATISEETRDVQVNFAGNGTSPQDTARISVTTTWTVPAADAVRILAAAVPGHGDPGAAPGVTDGI
jgi:hypothetical protein